MTVLKTDTTLASTTRAIKRLAGRSFYLPTEAPHFQMRVNGDWYVFCSIHKNASSSIRSIVENASHLRRRKEQSIFNFLFLNHLARSKQDIERASHIMVFVRHPLDRVVSCFQNKFIQQRGNRTIFADYEEVTGCAPQKVTFEYFVRDYLAKCFGGNLKVNHSRDRHIYTQHQQLLPVDYDVVERVDQFDVVMANIGLGHFLQGRANATSGSVEMPSAWSLTAEELNRHFCKTGETPDKWSLLNNELTDEINYLYRADLKAFGRLFDGVTA